MFYTLLSKGTGYAESEVLNLAAGETDTLILSGGPYGTLDVQIQVSNDEYRKIATMNALNAESTCMQVSGPISYRVVRQNHGYSVGCQLRGRHEMTGGPS